MQIINNIAPFILFYIMLGIGINASIADFIKILKDFKTLLIGLISQIIILPSLGFLIAVIVPVDFFIKIGIILITCVPSAVTSNYITKLANANIALSVCLTAISAALSFLTVPFILLIALPLVIENGNIFQNLNFKKMSMFLLLMTTVPILIGIFINTYFFAFTKKINKFFSISSLILFLLVIITAWASEWGVVINLYKSIGILSILLLIAIFITVYTFVNLFDINKNNKKTIIIEAFIQNAAMAIIVGGSALGLGSGYMAVAVIYGLLQYKALIAWWAVNKVITK